MGGLSEMGLGESGFFFKLLYIYRLGYFSILPLNRSGPGLGSGRVWIKPKPNSNPLWVFLFIYFF